VRRLLAFCRACGDDRLGNKEHSEDLVLTATDDELYGYDAVYRLTGFERGALNANKDDITSPDRAQTWSLEPLGNWDSTVNDGTTETRTHNTVNELTARTVGQAPQISLTYDDAGEPEGRTGPMVASAPLASHLSQDGSADGDHQYVWDYRNRLIEVKEYQTDTWNTTAEYRYDARDRRIHVAGNHLYGYVGGCPGALLDPSGEIAWDEIHNRRTCYRWCNENEKFCLRGARAAYNWVKKTADALKAKCYNGCEIIVCLPTGDADTILEDGCKIACVTGHFKTGHGWSLQNQPVYVW